MAEEQESRDVYQRYGRGVTPGLAIATVLVYGVEDIDVLLIGARPLEAGDLENKGHIAEGRVGTRTSIYSSLAGSLVSRRVSSSETNR